MTTIDKPESAHISVYSDRDIRISGLANGESELIRAAMTGAAWIKNEAGRIVSSPAFNSVPEPKDDLAISPFWAGDQRHDLLGNLDITRTRNVREIRLDEMPKYADPCFIIQHITAGKNRDVPYEKEYARCAEALESWGFECLRSRRGRNGRFWELWYLPRSWMAEGALKAAVDVHERTKYSDRTRAAIDFLAKSSVWFGTLDVCNQRLGLSFD